MWYAVFYFVMRMVPRLNDVLPYVENQMKHRLEHAMTWASMSGQTKYVNVKVPLGVACWMVANSPALKLPTRKDMMRAHVWHLEAILDLNNLFGGLLDPRVKQHAKRLKTLYKMLSECKKNKAFHVKALTYYQRHLLLVDGTIIPIDGQSETPDYEMACLAKMVHQNMSADTIDLDIDWCPEKLKAYISWPGYGLKTTTTETITPVCPATVRPYYVTSNSKIWEQSFRDVYGFEATKSIPLHAWYIDYVRKHKSYPDFNQLIKYAYERCTNRGVMTLPSPIAQFVREILCSFEHISKTLSVEEFIRHANASVCIKDRIVLERQ